MKTIKELEAWIKNYNDNIGGYSEEYTEANTQLEALKDVLGLIDAT